jgi:F-type H+-transporting ATPase subunit a
VTDESSAAPNDDEVTSGSSTAPNDESVTEEPSAEKRMKSALGPEMGSDAVEAAGAVAAGPRRNTRRWLVLGIGAIVALQVAAFFFVPPLPAPRDETPGFQFPRDAILANFELPAPLVAFDLTPSGDPDHPRELPTDLVTFDLTVSSSLFTGWIVMGLIILLALILARRVATVPGRSQNALEYVYEGLSNFATSLGGPPARRYVPVFAAFFLFILLGNWSGLFPGVGRIHELRAPTSDVNVTIGLALVAFSMFHIEGVRVLGLRGYLGKFFSLRAFREEGIAAGFIALFVGVIEFFLEFVKPVTLAMRLFGNIYGGEVALGVITGLTIVLIPVAIVGLEFLLNFMQALIFSVLALMFTIIAIESHDEQADHPLPEGNIAPEMAGGQPAPAH